ncbi:carbohydrate ABC transporter permease [Tropicimonas isoalkanivorans]|uniref:Alpha-1,4-digalacturonate transport system permease protein n=1 Tax=Tropicimonas isoalkanivorans TaxID=441112 RepID=A0A1I1DVE8_9RHOB|nr:sugar ABC transporter permease [Tropicimonas isoalkanivorans]SFB76553.1 alpha-1,4-digalacturonate transport system permease protein [Tropicimonas isoalkanivorans]
MLLRLISPLMNVVDLPMRALQRRLGISRLAWVFLLPNLLLFGTFAFLPILLNFAYAFTGTDNILLLDRTFVGAENFAQLLDCDSYLDPNTCARDLFWRAVHNTAWFIVMQVGFMVGFSLLTALVLNREIKARGFFRAVFFFPVLLSPVVVALVWKWVLQRNGILNAGLEAVGMDSVVWLLDRHWAFFWSVFLSVWAHMGFYTLILLAGLQAIPRDVYEAAVMDAAGPWRTFRRITLPLLMPTMLVVMVLALIKGVQTFDEIYAFTGGGPGSATTFIIQYIYETGFGGAPRLFGPAAAASLLLALLLVALTVIQLWITRRSSNG